ncbi:MAG: hypothetical protein WA751_07395 [Candidatus Dormiibacterota bacterium]
MTRVYKFPDGGSDEVTAGRLDGPWLVWVDTELNGPARLLAWDRSTGSVWTIAATPANEVEAEITFASDPGSSTGQLAWTMAAGTPKGGPSVAPVLHLYSLRTRRETTVHHGVVDNLFFWGGQLDYLASSGSQQHLMAASAESGHPVTVKRTVSRSGLASARSISSFPQGVVWTDYPASDSTTGLNWVLARGAKRPTSGPARISVAFDTSVFWADGYLIWNYLSDLPDSGIPSIPTAVMAMVGSNSYTVLPGAEVQGVAAGKALVFSSVADPPAGKTAALWTSEVVKLNQLPRPAGC